MTPTSWCPSHGRVGVGPALPRQAPQCFVRPTGGWAWGGGSVWSGGVRGPSHGQVGVGLKVRFLFFSVIVRPTGGWASGRPLRRSNDGEASVHWRVGVGFCRSDGISLCRFDPRARGRGITTIIRSLSGTCNSGHPVLKRSNHEKKNHRRHFGFSFPGRLPIP